MRKYEGPPRNIIITVGTKDDFLDNQLKPDVFAMAAAGTNVSVDLKLQVRAAFHCTRSGHGLEVAKNAEEASHLAVYNELGHW